MSGREDRGTAGGRSAAAGELFVGGLDNPRGLCFGPDGWLYVAEGGRGGTTERTDPPEFEQVPPPIGPYTGGPPTGRIRRISPDGLTTEVVAEGLPSSQTSAASGAMVSGVADIAFLDGRLHALIAGGGGSHGLAGTANSVVRIDEEGGTTLVADLSSFWQVNPTDTTDLDDREPDGTPFSMIDANGRLYLVEAHNGEIDEITDTGEISRMVDLSASQGHVIPTALAERAGMFYLVCLGRFPVRRGGAKLFAIDPEGTIEVLSTELTAAAGLAAGREALYVAETSTVDGSPPVPGTGRLLRIDTETGESSPVAMGLSFPTALVLGRDGALYLSNRSFGFPPGTGEILRIDAGERPCDEGSPPNEQSKL